jgi:hypothetical protein
MLRAVVVATVALGALLCAGPVLADGMPAAKPARVAKVHHGKDLARPPVVRVSHHYRRPEFPRYDLRSDYFPRTYLYSPVYDYDVVYYGVTYRPSYRALYFQSNPSYYYSTSYLKRYESRH